MTSITRDPRLMPVMTGFYEVGRDARREGMTLSQCPYTSRLQIESWIVGWNAEDGDRITGDLYQEYLKAKATEADAG